jgi:hypothetical protein
VQEYTNVQNKHCPTFPWEVCNPPLDGRVTDVFHYVVRRKQSPSYILPGPNRNPSQFGSTQVIPKVKLPLIIQAVIRYVSSSDILVPWSYVPPAVLAPLILTQKPMT